MIVYIQWSLVTVHFPLVVWRYYGPRSRCRVVLAQGTLLRKHPSLRAVPQLLFAGFDPKHGSRALGSRLPDASRSHRAERQLLRRRTARCIDLGEGVFTLV